MSSLPSDPVPLYDFNPGRKPWKIYAHKISSITDGNLILQADGTNSEIYFKQKNNEVYKISDLLSSGLSPTDEIVVHKVTASNYNVGNRNVISASAQGSFTDLELKNNNGTKLLIDGDTGNITADGTLSIDNITEKTSGSGITIGGSINITGSNLTNANAISAQNFNIGGTNVISAARQGNFRDIEMKNNSNQTTFLAYGDTGNIDIYGNLSVDNIIEKTSGSGVTIQSNLKLTNIISSINDNKLLYNSTTGEITYQPDNGGGGGSVSELNDLTDVYKDATNLVLGSALVRNETCNTIVGVNAGGTNTSGLRCTYIGHACGRYNASSFSVAMGYETLKNGGNHSTAIGYLASCLASGDYNTTLGGHALYSGLGRNNVAIGYFALRGDNINGNNNTAIGYCAHGLFPHGGLPLFGSNNIIIGSNSQASSAYIDNEITLGNSSNTLFRMPGLGGSNGDVLTYNNGYIEFASGGGGGGGGSTFDTLTNSAETGAKIHLHAGTTNGVTGTWKPEFCHIIGQKSNVGTGTIGFYHDEMAGLNYTGTGMQGFYINFGGPAVWISGQTNSSDDRIKHNEETITNGLETIRQLVPEKYLKAKTIDDQYGFTEAGFIAQKVLDISNLNFTVTQSNKELIEGDPSSCCYGLNYNSIFTYNVAATKELDAIVQQQQNTIQEQQNLINNLISRIEILEAN